ncbi:MAG: 50S ribosomal protein L11 methyltransferase [Pseudomonadota bacterium]
MTESGTRRRASAGPKVPGDLYIYYIQGRLPAATRMPETGFLGNWEEGDTSFLFFSRPAGDDVRRLMAAAPAGVVLQDTYEMTYAEWQGCVPPVQDIGGFSIVPPWEAAPRDGALALTIDPGVVFGTGQHPTTYDCLAALELAFSRGPVGRMIDLGTGTGILAIAGARLGCHRVLAVDLNRLAAVTAHRNVQLNNMAGRVIVAVADALTVAPGPAELIVANIHYAVMRQLVGDRQFMAGKRAFILSGLLRSEAKDIRFVLSTMGVKIIEEWHRDDVWFTFYAENRSC